MDKLDVQRRERTAAPDILEQEYVALTSLFRHHCLLHKLKACTQLMAWCPPMAPARLARHARRQAVRRTRHAAARRACRDENDLRSLEQMLGRVLTSE